nr:hypothetical protein [Moraxella osloensis]
MQAIYLYQQTIAMKSVKIDYPQVDGQFSYSLELLPLLPLNALYVPG